MVRDVLKNMVADKHINRSIGGSDLGDVHDGVCVATFLNVSPDVGRGMSETAEQRPFRREVQDPLRCKLIAQSVALE